MISASGAELLESLWRDFAGTTPQAARIRELLADRGELVHHDHLALRTFAAPAIGLDALGRCFEAEGWRPRERYRLDEAHLRARYWQHEDPNAPKIFISELDLEALSPGARAIVDRLLAQIPPDLGDLGDLGALGDLRALGALDALDALDARRTLLIPGRPWTLSYGDYLTLLAESEHAAWVAALGLRASRFTVDVGALISFPDLAALVAFLAEHAFRVDAHRHAAATRPESIPVRFSDTTERVPSGSYELAERAPAPPPSRYAPVSAAK